MLRLFRPQIEELIGERDSAVENWQKNHPDKDAFEDRGCDITSALEISVEAQINQVSEALAQMA